MENRLKDDILQYGIISKRRFYKKEKIQFLGNISKDFKEMGYEVKILAPQGDKGNSIDLLVGNVKKADLLVVANYDTPVNTFGLFTYKPFDIRTIKKQYFILTVIPLILLVSIASLFTFKFVHIEWLKGIFHWVDLIYVFIYIVFIYLIYKISKGIPNRINLNRNSSGIIGLLHIARYFKDLDSNKIAFVLTDYGCINHLGDQMLKEYIGKKMSKKKVVILDCIANDGILAACYSECYKQFIKGMDIGKSFKKDNEKHSTPNLYDNCIVFSTGIMKEDDFICPNVSTRKDNDLNLDNFNKSFEEIRKLILKILQ